MVALKNTFGSRGKKDISKQLFFKSGKLGSLPASSLRVDFTRGTARPTRRNRLGPIKASPGVLLPSPGNAKGSLLVVFCTKRETYFSEWVIRGSGKLQCEAFIGPSRGTCCAVRGGRGRNPNLFSDFLAQIPNKRKHVWNYGQNNEIGEYKVRYRLRHLLARN